MRPAEYHAAGVITDKELEAVELDFKGLSQLQIAWALGISRRGVRERLDNAARKVHLFHNPIPKEAA